MSSFAIGDLPQIIVDVDPPLSLQVSATRLDQSIVKHLLTIQVDDLIESSPEDAKVAADPKLGSPLSTDEGGGKHKEGVYVLASATDPAERWRLNFQHLLFRATLSEELFGAPINELEGGLHNVLDVATGTGIWAAEFASQYPTTNVIGTDLSLPSPLTHPQNCLFEIKDAEEPWDFPHQFDYIHGRALAICFKSHLGVIKSAFGALRPGGYLELQDCNVPFHSIDETFRGTRLENWVQHMMKGSVALGTDWTRVAKYKQYLEKAGFEDVVEKRYEWPLGTWAKSERMKTIGRLYREETLQMLESFSMAVMMRGLGMTVDEVKGILEGVREEVWSNKIHVYISVAIVYGRKPR